MKQTSEKNAKHTHDVQQIFAWIVAYKRAHDGNSPTLCEMMRACNISSRSVAWYELRRLAKAGKLRLGNTRGQARGITVIGGEWRWKDTSK